MYDGKAIYNPAGKAGEYARWACNLHVGCSNNCDYCYCKRGFLGSAMGAPQATLKKCFKDESDAYHVFCKELQKNADSIRREGGLFFSFSTDPCLPETVELTITCVMAATGMDVPCQILTKCAAWAGDEDLFASLRMVKDKVAVGATLTGMDSMEKGPTVAGNRERVAMLRRFREAGFRTFASVEPVVDIMAARRILTEASDACDFYKIGLLSGKHDYDWDELNNFVKDWNAVFTGADARVYWKESVAGVLGYSPAAPCVVGKDYDMFKKKENL